MDESGRCRRTDGKRWRCSKQVIPNEKYCHTHMHRGCRRRPPSTKLLESSSSSITTTTTPKHPPNLNLTPSINALSAAKDTQDDTTAPQNKAETSKVAAPRLKIINQELSSPKTVLIQGEECPEEGRRCRRTDGKRWRCTKEVIGENHKYCANHMYRGAKKRYYDYCNPNPYVLLKRDDKLVLGLHTNPSP